MVIYYSWHGNTKLYAESLAAIRKTSAFELAEIRPRKGFSGNLRAGYQAIMKKEEKVKRLPIVKNYKEVFVCSPIYAGNLAPAVVYFLRNTNLKNKKVNIIFTCKALHGHDAYKKNIMKFLTSIDCIPGEIYAFASTKEPLDKKILREQLESTVGASNA